MRVDFVLSTTQSFIYTINIRNPKTLPWGNKGEIGRKMDWWPLALTLWVIKLRWQSASPMNLQKWFYWKRYVMNVLCWPLSVRCAHVTIFLIFCFLLSWIFLRFFFLLHFATLSVSHFFSPSRTNQQVRNSPPRWHLCFARVFEETAVVYNKRRHDIKFSSFIRWKRNFLRVQFLYIISNLQSIRYWDHVRNIS